MPLEHRMKIVPSDLGRIVGRERDVVVDEVADDSVTTEMVVESLSSIDTLARTSPESNLWRRRKVLDPSIGEHRMMNLQVKMQLKKPLSVIEAVTKLPRNKPKRREYH